MVLRSMLPKMLVLIIFSFKKFISKTRKIIMMKVVGDVGDDGVVGHD